MHLLIVSGRSGSGKTISLDVLEDLGYYCIDNLPLSFANNLYENIDSSLQRVAVCIDVRNLPNEVSLLRETISSLQHSKHECTIMYLDATDDVLLKRFSETRRRHPLTTDQLPLNEAITKETSLLSPIAELADFNIDTSSLTSHQLKQLIKDHFQSDSDKLQIVLQSFGFKHGLPSEADFVFDVRCLPNPYWQPNLRNFTGLDEPVQNFLQQKPLVTDMIDSLDQFLHQWIPVFSQNNRSYITCAVGCTGGQHRSVYCINQLYHRLVSMHKSLIIRHRDMVTHKDTQI